jgi:hypothetical protein
LADERRRDTGDEAADPTPAHPTRVTLIRRRFHFQPTRCIGRVVFSFSLLVSIAGPALAQRPIALGVAGGVTAPVGSLGSDVVPGLHALAILEARQRAWPIGLELDADFTSFYFERALVGGGSSGSLRILSASLNLTRSLSGDSQKGTYLVAGAGEYHTSCTDDEPCVASTRAGWDLGLGATLPVRGQDLFVEARLRRSSRDRGTMSYFPVSLGFRF